MNNIELKINIINFNILIEWMLFLILKIVYFFSKILSLFSLKV